MTDFIVRRATGTAARDAVPALRERGYRPRTLGADRGYGIQDCVGDIRARRVTPHGARKKKHSAIDGRTTRHAGYAVSLRLRKRVEEVFGWMKTVGGFRRTRYRGVERTGLAGYLVATAYNLVRMAKLLDKPETATRQRMKRNGGSSGARWKRCWAPNWNGAIPWRGRIGTTWCSSTTAGPWGSSGAGASSGRASWPGGWRRHRPFGNSPASFRCCYWTM